ncbi:hypothetical protein PG994_008958 [Apiospora phragmitis]|uniref:Uncharacterized protein n=1 Tax=Apiospora phragmitis TaxID=2905665 RepID=A0ABR1UHX0_9PEZI
MTDSASAPQLICLTRDLKFFYKKLYDYFLNLGPDESLDESALGEAVAGFTVALEHTGSLVGVKTYRVEAYKEILDENKNTTYECLESVYGKLQKDYAHALWFLTGQVESEGAGWTMVLSMDDLFGTSVKSKGERK